MDQLNVFPSAAAEKAADLQARLRVFRRRLRLRDGVERMQRTLWIALAASVFILLLGRTVPVPHLAAGALAPAFVWLCAVAGYSLLRPLPLDRVARRMDAELGLKERLGTAVEIGEQGASPAAASANRPPSNLPARQFADALAAARAVDPRRGLPLHLLRRPMLAAAALLALALALAYLPNPMDAVLAERAAVEQAAEAEAERVGKIAEQVENSGLSPEKQAELLRQLDELARQLRENPGDREQALADLSTLEAELRRQIDPGAATRQAMLDAITAQLQALAQSESASPPDTAAALEQLAASLDSMTAEEQQSLAAALSQMAAQASQAGDTDLAQALAAMSQAAQAGDAQAASDAAGQVSEAVQNAQQALTDQQVLQQTLSQLQNSSQAIAQAGSGQQPDAAGEPDQTAAAGSGQQSGQGQGAGQQPGQGQGGQGLSGGGTNASTLPPGTGSGQAQTPENADTGALTGDPAEQVFVPWERQASEGGSMSIPGQDSGQGETITHESPNPLGGLSNPALIPYQQVYTRYFDAAQQAISGGDIPPAYRDLVREYFVLLAP